MRTSIPEKILRIVDDLDRHGSVPLTRLTVLEQWFRDPHRLSAFGLWAARRAAARKGKTGGVPGQLLDEARILLGTSSTWDSLFQRIDPAMALALIERARLARNGLRSPQSGPASGWQLRIVENGLILHTSSSAAPEEGGQLATDLMRSHQAKAGQDPDLLDTASRNKLVELVRFMFNVEGGEDFLPPEWKAIP